MEILPLTPAIGAEVRGVDLAQPLDEAAFRAIERAWYAHGVLLFRGQDLTEEDQVGFAARFGELGQVINKHGGVALTRHPSVMLVSNIRQDGKPIGALPDGEMLFHSDQCYVERPCMATFLYAIEVPGAGGNTLLANTTLAWETLPAEIKAAVEGRKAMNVYDYAGAPTQRSEALAADAPRFAHPVVRTHPATGRRALFVNRLMTQYIEGVPRAESDRLLSAIFVHQEQRRFVYEHVWRPGDLVLWDNRCTLHARTDFSAAERRLLRRCIVLGERPF
ncbi:MAG TPA: TauD/TfdA family dioxygenase [Stellaceae bacterium]|nr:TauD/TfdA family dioxygenase [Stellaceae bacterium]